MSYGIKVYDSLGATMFDSDNLVEMTAHYFTCKGNVAFPAIPDWVGGSDSRTQIGSSYTRQQQNVSYSAYSWPSGRGGTTNFYGVGSSYLAFDYDATPYPAPGQVMIIGGNEYKVTGPPTLANQTSSLDSNNYPIFNYSNARHYIPFDQDMTSFRNSTATRTFKTYEYPNYEYSIYVRPLSASYSGQFGWAHVGANLMNPMMIYDSTGSTTNTFEVMVASSAKAWGAIADTRTAKFLGGMSNYAIACQTGQIERHTPSGPLVSTTTFDSRTRIAKMILAKGWGGGTDYSNSSFSLGSLSASSTKRWARLDSTQFVKLGPYPQRWSAKYQWNSNNSISIVWNSNGGGRFSLSDSYVTELPFIVAEFGVGA